MLRRSAAVAALLLTTPLAAAADLDQRVAVAEGSRLRIELDQGSVAVVTHDAPEVRVQASARGLGASAVHFRLRKEGDALVLTGLAEPWLEWLQAGPRIQVRVFVPADCEVELAPSGSLRFAQR
jgi:hypothetical protein